MQRCEQSKFTFLKEKKRGKNLKNSMSEEGECSEDEISLTHDEQWDDSILINAWDSAIEQFQVIEFYNFV